MATEIEEAIEDVIDCIIGIARHPYSEGASEKNMRDALNRLVRAVRDGD